MGQCPDILPGKSTFIKLLLRLYEPTEGEILLNGVNIREYDKRSYYRVFASGNVVTSNGTSIDRIYGRQGDSSRELYVDGAEVKF